ncbi:DMT family transporter [Falsiroseomonas sp.]|uniref:DMT family transporter n=1 Tax=Falsiroseomonas sp. TaxID=2870721 RepID=UPI0035635134
MPRLLRNLAMMIAVGTLWGLTPAMGKLALAEGMRPLGVASISAAVAASVLFGVAFVRGQAPPMDRAHIRQYVAGGVVGLAFAHLFAFTGLQRVPAGLFALMVPLSGLFTMLFFALAGIERATAVRLIGSAVGMAGVALAMAPGAALPDPALLPWAAIMLLTPVCYAASNLFSVKFAVRGTPPLAQASGTVIFAALGAAVIAWPLGHIGLPPRAGIALLLLGQGIATAVAYMLYFRLLVNAGGVFTSQAAYVITLAGLFWGFLLFDEVPGWLTIPAASLIFGGVALVTLAPRPAR